MVHLHYTRQEVGRLTRRDLEVLQHEHNPHRPAPPKIGTAADAKAHKAQLLARRQAAIETWEP